MAMTQEPSGGAAISEFVESVDEAVSKVIAAFDTEKFRAMIETSNRTLAMVAEQMQATMLELEEGHRRAALLAAYRRRREWKLSDKKNLATLGVNRFAERRMQRLRGTGRPVVLPYQSVVDALALRADQREPLYDRSSTRHERLAALKQDAWFWPHYVEALYRGELQQAQAGHRRGEPGAPALLAEEAIAQALGLSAAKVHQLCVAIHKRRKADADDANLPATTLTRFEQFLDTGDWDGVWDWDCPE